MNRNLLRCFVTGTLTGALCASLGCGSSKDANTTGGSGSGSGNSGASASSGTGGGSGNGGATTGNGGATTGTTGSSSTGSATGTTGTTTGAATGATGSTTGATGTTTGATGAAGSTAGSTSGATGTAGSATGSSGSGIDAGSSGTTTAGPCGAGDTKLPPEPVDPPICTTLTATRSTPDETSALDTARIQAALNTCGAGKAVKLTGAGANHAFVTGPLTITSTTLMVDAGTTLYASRNPALYGCTASTSAASNSCGTVIMVTGTSPGLVGTGTIDGQGGEPIIGQTQSWWDISVALRATNGSASNPSLIDVTNATNFVMHNIHIFNSPKFHVKLASTGFVVWGAEVMTPSKATNSVGTALSPFGARNTDGIDPGGSTSTSNGFIVCTKISVGDDQIAIKGGKLAVTNLTIAHDNFGTGHGMSIGSETNAGVSGINVYDLTIDGSIPTGGAPASDINGLRIKSDASRGGLVDNVTYNNICVRDVDNPILLNPNYSTATGTLIPLFTNITIANFHALTSGVAQTVTFDGFDSSHISTAMLSNVVVDGTPTIVASNAKLAIGSGGISFPLPTGTGVTVTGAKGTPSPISCDARWVAFP